MNLLKDLAGGVLVILAAGLIGIAQNAARDDSIPLIPKAANAVTVKTGTLDKTTQDKTTSNNAAEDVTNEPAYTGGKSLPTPAKAIETDSPVPTDLEIAHCEVSMGRLNNLLHSGFIILLDARSHEEYDAGHIAGAVSFPYDELLGHYDELRETIPINGDVVIYCESVTCDQSENLATELKLMGYGRVVIYKGGWQEWDAAGLPIETSEFKKTEH